MNVVKSWVKDLLRGSRARARAKALRAEQLETLLERVQQLADDHARLEREIDELRADSRRIAQLRILVERELNRLPPFTDTPNP